MRPTSDGRTNLRLRALVALLLTGAVPRPCSARIINVPASQPTLQAAVAAAASGDTILFAPGTYTGGVWIQNKAIVAGSRFLTTGDTSYIAQTVISGLASNVCGGNTSCTGDASFEFGSHAGPSAVVGLTLTGAVKGVRTSCRTDVRYCHSVGHVLAGDGVNYLPRSSGTVSNCLFANNRDDGIDLNGDVDVTITNNTIIDNLDDGIEFRMYPYAGPTLNVIVSGNRFINNDGDGIQLIDSPDSSHREVRIERNLFQGNHKATIGCMPDQQTDENYSAAPLAEHVVIANNTCVGNFYGICGGANSVVLNNIISGTTNSALRRVAGYSICAYNLLWSNGLNNDGSNLDISHTLLANPRLDANQQLTSGSPAIDAGIANYQWRGQTIVNLPPSSYAGSAPDLGAYESVPPPVNTAPAVSAGPAQTITLPADAVLDGTVGDDGLPNPPATVTTAWSAVGGPGPVIFQNPSAVDTRATFTSPGTYLLRLAAWDGTLNAADSVQITVQPAPGTASVVERRMAAGTDDAEENSIGSLALASTDLEMVHDLDDQHVGLRFPSLAIPPGARILWAYVQFEAKESQSEVTHVVIQGETSDNALAFSFTNKISPRPRTVAATSWAPAPWTLAAGAGPDQRTPDLASVIQEIVNRPGWASGNALVLLINGTGHRTAWSFEGKAAGAPLLHVEYESGPPPPPPSNTAPVVDAGPTQAITLPADAALAGTVGDDGLPSPPGVITTAWSAVGGPGTVTFLDPGAPETRATFDTPGDYLLRLTASDGAFSVCDSVQITVRPATVTAAPGEGCCPGPARPEFALRRLSPVPSRGALQVEFSLADARPAALEMLDLMGRRVAERDLGSPGPGLHTLVLHVALRPGLYAVRLVQGGEARVMRAVVVR